VVGRQEVLNRREMHWIRIDRYYNFDQQGEASAPRRINTENEYSEINHPDRVSVLFQPIMCHQCDNAPCESVCPVLATVHSSEGLNQMVYNRCVGTRYCANNCPYKVRRSPACVQTCPTQALTFGNLKDPNSRVSKAAKSERAYKVLDHHLNTQPSVSYLNDIRYKA